MSIVRSAAAAALAASFSMASPAAAQDRQAEDTRLNRTLEQALEAGGPWLLPSESALIARKCGYAPGSRDSQSVNMDDGVLVCTSGRRVDDPEVRAMMAVAGPRISRRVTAVMESPEVRDAISAVADDAVVRALRSLRDVPPRRIRRR